MKKVVCDLCGKEAGTWVAFGHPFCDECAEKFKEYIQITMDIAEQERKRDKTINIDDISKFVKIKDGNIDIIRASREFAKGDILEICYEGFAYKDSVKCKVTGCSKSASDGYIIELINL